MGRLSTASKPRSSSALSAVVRPAPAMPVTRTMRLIGGSGDRSARERQPDLGGGRGAGADRAAGGAARCRAAGRSTARAAAARAWRRSSSTTRPERADRRNRAAARCRGRAPRAARPAPRPAGRAAARRRSTCELVIGDQQGAGIDQPQREIGLAAARGAQQHDADAAELDAARVQPERAHVRRCPAAATAGSACRPALPRHAAWHSGFWVSIR